MNLYKRLLCVILCISIILSMAGCGQAKNAATDAATEPSASAESYLAIAQSFVDQWDYDAAIAILEQAQGLLDDQRIDAMLAEVKALRSIPLEVEYALKSSTLPEEQVQIHSIAAEQLFTQKIRYTVEYTAPVGMNIQLWGVNLFSMICEATTVEQGTFVFEIDAKDVKKLAGDMQICLAVPELEQVVFDVHTKQQGEADTPAEEADNTDALTAYEIGYFLYDAKGTGNVRIQSFRVQETDTSYHFTMEYTAVGGMTIESWVEYGDVSESLCEDGLLTEEGQNVLEFDTEKESLTYLGIAFMAGTNEEINIGVEFPMSVRMTFGNPAEDPVHLGYTLNKAWKSDKYQIHDCTTQWLDNDYIRYMLDITLPENAYVTVNCIYRDNQAEEVYQAYAIGGRHQLVFDIPVGKVMETKEVTFLIYEEKSRYQNLISIYNAHLNALTDGTPVTEPMELDFLQDGAEDFWFGSCTVQMLDNSGYRFTLEYTTPENLRCGIFDPPNGDVINFSWVSGLQAGHNTFAFDISAEAADQFTELTFFAGDFNKLTAIITGIAEALDSDAKPVEVTVISHT